MILKHYPRAFYFGEYDSVDSGMGIIVLTIAILPLLGIGGMELFIAEAPGPTKDKTIHEL